MKIVRKEVVATFGGLTALLALLFGRDTASYVGTVVSQVQQQVVEHVPVSFQLARARNAIVAIGDQIQSHQVSIAEEEVAVERLAAEVKRGDESLAKQRQQLVRLRDDAQSGREAFVYQGQAYNLAEVKSDLARRFARFQAESGTVEQQRKMLAARQEKLAAARQSVAQMANSRHLLQSEVEQLEARRALLETAPIAGIQGFEDSQLARTRELVDQIEAKLTVAERSVAATSVADPGSIPVEPASGGDIVHQVTELFGTGKEEAPAPALLPTVVTTGFEVETETKPQPIADDPALDAARREMNQWLLSWMTELLEKLVNN